VCAERENVIEDPITVRQGHLCVEYGMGYVESHVRSIRCVMRVTKGGGHCESAGSTTDLSGTVSVGMRVDVFPGEVDLRTLIGKSGIRLFMEFSSSSAHTMSWRP
jgi:hypothetical protein